MTILIGNEQNNFLDLTLSGTTPGVAVALFGNDTLASVANTEPPGSLLFGNQENDVLLGRGVGDTLYGGQGADTITGEGDYLQLMFGDSGNDSMQGERSLNTLYGGLGDDNLLSGDDNLFTDTGNNLLFGDLTAEQLQVLAAAGLDTTPGNDTMDSFFGLDTMVGDGGDDSMRAGPEGQSVLFGNQGDDTLVGASSDTMTGNARAANSVNGQDSFYGGVGADYLYYDVRVALDVTSTAVPNNLFMSGDLGEDTVIVDVGTREAIELEDDPPEVVSGRGHVIIGDRVDQTEFGSLAGNDYLAAGGANLFMAGNRGNDELVYFGAGSNAVSRPSLFGGQDDDSLTADGQKLGTFSGGVDRGLFSGDLGDDYLGLSGSSHEGNLLRGDSAGTGGVLSSVGSGNDVLIVQGGTDTRNNTLVGGEGDDYLASDSGGSTGGNFLSPGDGMDTIVFGQGDTLDTNTAGANLYIGVGVNDIPIAIDNDDTFRGDGNVIGSPEDDVFDSLNSGAATLLGGDDQANFADSITGPTFGNEGNDTIGAMSVAGSAPVSGGAGDDSINVMGAADSSISGGDGNDVLEVGDANDSVTGDAGNDTIDVGSASSGVSGGEGNDNISVDNLEMGGTITGDAGNDFITSDTVAGDIDAGADDDVLSLGSVTGNVTGGDGDDSIEAAAASGSVTGGAGNDTLSANTSSDAVDPGAVNLDGGEGNDAIIGGNSGGDMLSGGEGDDSLWGGDVPEEPTTMGTSVENLDGDMLTGGAGADQFFFQDTLETGTASFGGLGSLGSSDVLNQFNDENIVGTSEFAGFAPGTFQVGDYLMDTSNVDYGGTGFWSGTSTNMFDPGSFSGSAQFQTTGHVDTITDFNPTDDQIVLRSGGGFGAGQFTTGNLADIIADGSTPATGGGSFAFGAGTLASIDAVLGSNQFDDVVTGPSGTIQVTGSFGQFFYDTDNTALYYGVGNGSMALLVDFENPEPGFSAADIDFLNDGDINIF